LVFYHWYNTETDWDGAVVEINKNGTWEDLGGQMIENGYNGLISVNPESNISGQEAFSGNSGEFLRTIVDLTPYKNNTVQIRFRFVSDAAQGAEGWYIDNITLMDNLVTLTNTASIMATTGISVSSGVSTLIFKGKPVKISQPKLSGFKVSPNPFNEQILVTSNNTDYKLTLTDVAGKVVLSNTDAKNTTVIETSTLPAGTYFLKLQTNLGMEVIKLVK
jgi:hypothetical protein